MKWKTNHTPMGNLRERGEKEQKGGGKKGRTNPNPNPGLLACTRTTAEHPPRASHASSAQDFRPPVPDMPPPPFRFSTFTYPKFKSQHFYTPILQIHIRSEDGEEAPD